MGSMYDNPSKVIHLVSNGHEDGFAKIFDRQESEINRLKSRIDVLESMILGMDTIDDVKNGINSVNYISSNVMSSSIDMMLKSIEDNFRMLVSIKGKDEPFVLNYDVEKMLAGRGVKKTQSNGKSIISFKGRYDIVNSSWSGDECTVTLGRGRQLTVVDCGTSNRTEVVTLKLSGVMKKGESLRVFLRGGTKLKGGLNVSTCKRYEKTFIEDHNTCIDIICVGDNKYIHLIK